MSHTYEELRERMVKEQLEARGITDPRVLAAMRKVPRHHFVPRRHRAFAYDDCALPIWFGATISQPLMVAMMAELLRIEGGEKTLEVGAGSGYQAAILCELGADLITVERVPRLAAIAENNLRRHGYTARVLCADGSIGLPEEAPFDRILFTASPPKMPKAYLDQLAPGGRIVGPVGSRAVQELVVVEKTPDGRVLRREHGGCQFLPLVGEQGWDEKELSNYRWEE